MNFEDLSPEQKEKARACKTIDELISFAEEEGFKLTNAMLEGISGGSCRRDCPWNGAICVKDTDCITNRSCPAKSLCLELLQCSKLGNCPDDVGPIPIPIPDPISIPSPEE